MPFSASQIGSINNASNVRSATHTSRSTNIGFTMDTFLQLLAAQMQNQDILNPTSNNEYMSQMVLMSVMQAVDNMSQMSLTSYASSMIGKNVTVAEIKNGKVEEVQGVVTGVSIYGGAPVIHVNGRDYSLSQIMVVGNNGKPDKPNGEIEKPDGEIEGPDGELGESEPEENEGSESEEPKA